MSTTPSAEPRHEPQDPFVYESKTDEVLRQLAIDWLAGCITSDRHIEDTRTLGMVFMPLGMIDPEDAKAMFVALGPKAMIYEHLSEAGPRQINGWPMFTSFKMLDTSDFDRFHAIYKELGGGAK